MELASASLHVLVTQPFNGDALVPAMTSILSSIFMITAALAAITLLRSSHSRLEIRYFYLGVLLHVVGALAQVFVITSFYGGGDILLYYRTGVAISDMVQGSPVLWKDLFQLFIGGTPDHLSFVIGAGTTTGTMSALAALLDMATGRSLVSSCIAMGLIAFIGQFALYQVFREEVPRQWHKVILIAAFAIPSVVFWTSALLKESLAFCGFGLAVFGVAALVKNDRRSAIRLLIGTVGILIVSISKPYILFVLAIALGAWFAAVRSKVAGEILQIRPVYLVVGCTVSVAAIIGLGELFPQYALEEVGEHTSRLQQAYRGIEAGSTYELGTPEARSMSDQLIFMPIALVSSLFRPVLFEVHNLTSLVNALETTVLTVMLVVVFVKHGIRRTGRIMLREPFLIFCVVFVLLFSLAVGLTAPNLGTLSRYRTPMMPMYWFIVLLLYFSPPKTSKKNMRATNSPHKSTRTKQLNKNHRRGLGQK